MPRCRPSATLVAALAAIVLAACQMPRSEPSIEQPALTRLLLPHAGALADAGIAKIVAWSDRPGQPVQVMGRHGAIYFPWRREVPFAAFAIDVGPHAVRVRADDVAAADDRRYPAALDYAVREALRLARDQNAVMEERERARH